MFMQKARRLETLLGPPPKKLVQSHDNLSAHRQYDDPSFEMPKRSRWICFILKGPKRDYFLSPYSFPTNNKTLTKLDTSEQLRRKFTINQEKHVMYIDMQTRCTYQ